MEAIESQLWAEYRTGDGSARNRLAEQYLPVAQRIAKALYGRRYNNTVEFGDYLQLGYMGLLEAIERYQPESTASFATFAAYRIKGSILNGLPKMTELGDYHSYVKRARRDRTLSLSSEKRASAPNFEYLADLIVNIALTYQLDEIAESRHHEQQCNSPYFSHKYEEVQRLLGEAVVKLLPNDRRVIQYHYFEHMGFEEIARLLCVSKGRVSQLHKRALCMLRDHIRSRAPDIENVY